MQTLSTFEASSIWLKPHQKLDGASLMDHLFSRMNGAYPNRWRSSFRDMNAVEDWKLTWADAFEQDGITPQDVATGIKNCRRMYDWPPSLTEFLRACRPSLDPELAFHEAVAGLTARCKGETGQWSHPAIYHAAVAIGQHEMLGGSFATLKARWGKALADEIERGQWDPVPEPVAALPEPKRTEDADAQAQAAMQKLGIGDVLSTSGQGPKDWARRILDSADGRPVAVVEMARRALERKSA